MIRQRVTSILVFMCVLCCFGTTAAYAAEPTAQGMQKKYTGIEGLQAEFTQVLVHKESGARDTRSGLLYFAKPLLVRWETLKPVPELLLVGKDVIWNVFPDEEIAYKYSTALAQDSRSIVRVITGQTRLDEDFYMEVEGKEGNLFKLRLYPKEPTQSLVEALLWVNNANLIKRIRVYDFYGNENDIAFTKLTLGKPGKDSLFTYTPPEHFAVEDRSSESGAVMQKPLMQ